MDNTICEINGKKYDLSDIYELLVTYQCGEEAQRLIREETNLAPIPAWRLAEQIKREKRIPRMFKGEARVKNAVFQTNAEKSDEKSMVDQKMIIQKVAVQKPIVQKGDEQKARPQKRTHADETRVYTEEDYKRDVILRALGRGLEQQKADMRAHHYEYGRDPYNLKKSDGDDSGFMIGCFFAVFCVIVVIGTLFSCVSQI